MISENGKRIIRSLQPLLEEAQRTGKLLYNDVNGFVATATALRHQQNAHGRFIWGPLNWELVERDDPKLADAAGYWNDPEKPEHGCSECATIV